MIDCCKKFEYFSESNNCFDCKTKAVENNLSFEIEREKICRIHIDNCLIKDYTVKKCDYVFFDNISFEFFFVELKKPNKAEYAVAQIIQTIEFLKKNISINKEKIFGIVLHNAVPNANSKINNLKEKFKKNIGNELVFKSKSYKIK